MKYRIIVLAMVMTSSIAIIFQSISTAADKAPNVASLVTDMQACSAKSPDTRRLSCFDSLAKKLVDNDPLGEITVSELPENIGGGKFDTNRKTVTLNKGLVISCKKSQDGKWFFIFDNKQIWKQVNADNRRYNYKDCKFNVTIKEDGFGYKMLIEEQNREIRIKRYK